VDDHRLVVQAVVSWYGLSDFTLTDDPDGIVPVLMSGPQSEHPDRYDQASPVSHVTAESPPTLLMHGREDEVVDIEQSRKFFAALDEAGVNAVRYELHDLNHVWAEHAEAMESERVGMDLLAAEPTHAQSVYEATHLGPGDSPTPLIPDLVPAGPAAIRQFLDRTIR